MSVEIEIADVFRSYFDDRKTVKAEGKTVGECLRYIAGKYPLTQNMFIDEKGTILSRFSVYLNGESIDHKGGDTVIKNGDKLDLVYNISGG